MKISKAISEINKEIEKVQFDLDNREGSNGLRISGLLGKKEGLNLALEIISNNM